MGEELFPPGWGETAFRHYVTGSKKDNPKKPSVDAVACLVLTVLVTAAILRLGFGGFVRLVSGLASGVLRLWFNPAVMFFVAGGFGPAHVASRKGQSYLPWFVYGSLLFEIALIHALLLKPSDKATLPRKVRQGSEEPAGAFAQLLAACNRLADGLWVLALVAFSLLRAGMTFALLSRVFT